METIDAVAKVGAGQVNSYFQALLDAENMVDARMKDRMEALTKEYKAHLKQGRFVAFRLFTLDGRLLAEKADVRHNDIKDLVPVVTQDVELGRKPQLLQINGRHYLLVAEPLVNSWKEPRLKMVALFAVATDQIAAFYWQAGGAVIFVIWIVMATCFLMYPFLVRLFDRTISLSEELLLANLDTISTLGSAIAKRDSDTDDHNFRVTLYAVRLAEALDFSNSATQGLIKGAFLHDVGKIGIYDRILLKPGQLDPDEFTEMRKHVKYGIDIVSRCRWLKDAVEIVGSHHEKFDGSGYPFGLKGQQIPLEARVFAVTDVFDALTSKRPYKDPLSLDLSLELICEGKGTHFDPDVVDRFVSLAPELYAAYGNGPAKRPKEALGTVLEKYFFSVDLPFQSHAGKAVWFEAEPT